MGSADLQNYTLGPPLECRQQADAGQAKGRGSARNCFELFEFFHRLSHIAEAIVH